MEHTLVAVFSTQAHAHNARDDLAAAGFPLGDIHINAASQEAVRPAGSDVDTKSLEHESIGDRIRSFFHHLFGGEDTDVYAEAVKRGGYVLTVKAVDDEQARHASEVLNRQNPVDMKERVEEWKSAGWNPAASAAAGASSDRTMDAQEAGIDSGTATRLPVEEHAAPDDTDFRTHWQTSYASLGGRYEDYAPAYRYGSAVHGSDRYRNRSWEDAEPELRAEWEAKHAGSPWEKARDAVRIGWERMIGS